jgi:cytoskeleton protein RodZ
VSDAVEGPGPALKSARERLGVTVREVADALNLPLHVVEAMEANEFDRLPQPVFARGYLRSYAKLLELDPNALVAGLPKLREEPEPSEPTTPADARSAWIREHPGMVLGVGVLVVIALVLLLVLWLVPGEESTTAEPDAAGGAQAGTVATEGSAGAVESAASLPAFRAPTPQAEPSQEAEASPEAEPSIETGPSLEAEPPLASATASGASQASRSRPEAPSGVPAPGPSGSPNDAATVETSPSEADLSVSLQAGTAAAAESKQTPAAQSVQASTASGARRITPTGDDLLALSFSEDCWVEVKDLDGNKLFSDLGRAGTTRRLEGQAPFRLLLGYAPGVIVTLNGDPVAVARFTRNNVASLVVGE